MHKLFPRRLLSNRPWAQPEQNRSSHKETGADEQDEEKMQQAERVMLNEEQAASVFPSAFRLPPRAFVLSVVVAVALWHASGGAGVAAARASGLPSAQATRRGDVEQLIEEGAAALERGDQSAAREAFQKALKIEPANPSAHTYLGVLADREGKLAQAERHFAAAVKADPKSPPALNNYGAVLLRLGLGAQAAAQFEASLRLDPQQPSALTNLAQIRFDSNTPEGIRAARDLFERARAFAPDAEIARALVVIALRLNDNGAAAAYYRDYLARLPEAGARTSATTARAQLGSALLVAGLTDEAAQELDAVVRADPSNVPAIINLSRAYMARKDIRAAGRTLEGAVARGVESAPLYATLAEVYEVSGHVENAIPAMRLAIERDPNTEAYRFRYAMLLTDTQAPGAAVIRLRESLSKFPQSVHLWFALGVAHFKDRKLDDAAEAFTRAAKLDPKFAPAQVYLGMTYAEQGHFAEAVPFYERALEVDERLAATHYLLAAAILKQPSYDTPRAEQHLSRAVALDPSLVPARLALAKLLLDTNRLQESAAQLERLVAAEPELADAYYQLGRAYHRLKRAKEAEATFATFKRLSDKQQEQERNQQREIVRRLSNVRF